MTKPYICDIMTRPRRKEEKGRTRVNIQGYQKMTLLDYPGRVAATVFCGGCDLRCPFCHNASLVKTPRQVPSREAEVLTYLEKRKGLLDGVCVTGGEPLLQADLEQFLMRLKELGYSVKLDTNGSQPNRLQQILDSGLVDKVAMDVKSAPQGYQAATGTAVDPAVFLQSMELIKKSSVEREFRTTLVKGIHQATLVEEAAALVGDQPYFLQNFKDSGDILGGSFAPFSPEELEDFLQRARKFAPLTQLRG